LGACVDGGVVGGGEDVLCYGGSVMGCH